MDESVRIAKVSIPMLEGIDERISCERRVYESVDDGAYLKNDGNIRTLTQKG